MPLVPKLRLAATLLSALLLLLVASSAHAQALMRAKNAGYVGEKRDGMVAIIEGSNAPQAVVDLVEDVNEKRQRMYSVFASKNEKTAEEVAATAGAKLISVLRPGQHYQAEDGSWKKRTEAEAAAADAKRAKKAGKTD